MPVRAALLLLILTASIAAEVRIVSGQEEPLAKAATAAADKLRQDGHTPIRLRLDDPAISTASLRTAGVVIAVGADSAKRLATLMPEDIPLVRCLDPAAEPTPGRHAVILGSAAAAQVGLLQRLLPKAKIIGVLAKNGSPAAQARVKAWREALPKGLELVAAGVDDPASVAAAIESLWQARVDVVSIESDPETYTVPAMKAVLLGALRRKVPVIGFSSAVTRAGALASVEPTAEAQGRSAAVLAATVLADKAAAPPTLVAQNDLTINLTVAERLWVSIPADLRGEASQIFGSTGR